MEHDQTSRGTNPAGDSSWEAAYTYLERHANRVLFAGGLVTVNLVLLEVIRHVGGESAWHPAISLALVISMFLLLFRLAVRMLRFAVRSARHQTALSQTMMEAVERIADRPAGLRGTIEALAQSASEAGLEVVTWNEHDRTMRRVPKDGGQGRAIVLTAAMARSLHDCMFLRKPVLVPDVTVVSGLPAELARHEGAQAMIVAPMWVADELVGLVLKRFATARQMLRSQETTLVSGFAALGAVALGKAMVVDREQLRVRDIELLMRSMQLAGDGLQRPEHLATYALQAAEATGSQVAAIYAIVAGQLRLVGSHGIGAARASGARRLSMRSTFLQRVQQSAEEVLTISVGDIDRDSAATLGLLGFTSDLVVQPVCDASGVIGMIVLETTGRGGPDDRERSMLDALARQTSLSIERSRMLRAIHKRSRHLACTPKLARSLTGQRDQVAVSRIAARELHEGFGFGRVSIGLRDAEGCLSIVASSGMLAQSSMQVSTTLVLEAAFSSGRPYVSCVGEPGAEGAGASIDDPNAPVGCRSQLVVPIIGSDHEAIGVIAVYERDPDMIGEDDLHMLETIADQLAGTIEQADLFETLERNYFKTVEALSAALEAKDAYTLDHARSITEASAAVGRRLGMGEEEIHDLKLGALLHDIGKIGVPGEILNKPGPLSEAEFLVMKEHTRIGEQIIAPIEFLNGVRPLVLHEHERWDGAGYPHGLRGNDIPLGARIIFVCDSWHAMTSDRPYRKSLPLDEARRRLCAGAGTQFDPQVVTAFLAVLDEGEAPGMLCDSGAALTVDSTTV